MPRLLLVSNRLPVTVKMERDEVVVTRSAGGLATGLRGPHERSSGLWIGWPGDVSKMRPAQRAKVETDLAELRCVPVHLSSAEVSRYYDGFSNSVLWPLFHYLLDRIPIEPHGWDVYRDVNERFAERVAAHYQHGDLVWVHDYQLLLVPGMLRARIPNAKIGFFLHIPFPASEILRTLPWREQILEGLLGADLLGFHTFTYRSHFSSAILRILGVATHEDRVRHAGRETRLGVFPMGIDAKTFTTLAEEPDVLQDVATLRHKARGERTLLGIDRLDYTKGIPRRLLAFERLLERQPSLRGKVRLVQIAVPSREKVASYQEYRRTVNEQIGRINGAFGTVDWVPIHYVHRSFTERQVVALYKSADVMLVTPLRDGMNLVAKEFVTSRTDEDGVLVLSEFAGAAAEMGEALQVNPYDIEASAITYGQALEMPEDERRFRMRSLRERIMARDVHGWASSFIGALEDASATPTVAASRVSPREAIDELSARLCHAERLLLLLDYDGTLVPFARAPELAAPDVALRSLLAALAARPGTLVHIISGRRRETLERWFGDLPIGLHAEHGFWSRSRAQTSWVALSDHELPWKKEVRTLLDQFASSTPASLVEEKSASLAWHYRMAEPELAAARADEVWRALETMCRGRSLQLLRGDRVIEVRVEGVHKGLVVERILATVEPPLPTICAMGDDTTDDDLFRALPDEALTLSVGFHPSLSKYRVPRPSDARALLESLVHSRD